MPDPGSVRDGPIRSFYIPGEEGISEYWRRNKSSVPALELARLLAGLRKLTGYLGRNVGSILWEGMKSSQETSAIILDPAVVRGRYPVPASKTDYVVGITVREAYRRIEWSEKAEKLAWEKVGRVEVAQRPKFEQYLEMGERIYSDGLAGRSVLGLYARVARLNDFQRARRNFLPPPSVEELLYIWWVLAAGGEEDCGDVPGGERAVFYREPLGILRSISGRLVRECGSGPGVLERCSLRSDLYAEVWPHLLDHIRFWPPDRRSVLSEGEDTGILLEPPTRIPEATLRAIEAALAEDEDLTPEVRKICDDEETVTIKTGRVLMPLEERLDRRLYWRVKASLQLRSKKRKVISRGLNSGKIDARRLYRAPLTGRIFFHQQMRYEMDDNIVLLVDASGSMWGPKWKNCQQVCYALYEALRELNPETRVFAYNEAFDVCYLTELSRKDRLYTVVPKGKTASGEAIIATALMLRRRPRRRRQLIVHLTDGASNWGGEVKHAVEYCRQQNIGLITLGLGCTRETREELKRQYREQVRFLDDIRSLPQKFNELIKRQRSGAGRR